MATHTFTILLKPQEEGGYTVRCIELPGCISQGETKEEAVENIKEAIEGYLEARAIMAKEKAGKAEVVEIII